MSCGRGTAIFACCGGAFLFACLAIQFSSRSLLLVDTKNVQVDVGHMNKTRAPGTKHEHVDAIDMNKTRAPGTKRMGPPFPAHLADLENEHVDMSDMKKAQLIVPGTKEEVAVFIYKNVKSDNILSALVERDHTWDPKGVGMLVDLWKAGSRGNFLDVGGNIGTFSLPISHYILPYGGQVVAVEGMPSTAAHLKAGIVANKLDNIALYQYAVSGPGEGNSVKMMLAPTNKGASSIWGNNARGRWQQVALTTIDAILSREPALQKVLAMKMDIEGNEGRALKGARELLAKYPPCYIAIELVSGWLANAGTPLKSVKQQLHDAGYNTSSIDLSRKRHNFAVMAQRDLQQCLARCSS